MIQPMTDHFVPKNLKQIENFIICSQKQTDKQTNMSPSCSYNKKKQNEKARCTLVN